MAEIPSLEPTEVEGSFYSFPSYKMRMKSRELSLALLREQKVAVLPGTAFGPSGENHVRICFAGTEENIDKAMDGVKLFFSKHA